MTGAKPKTLIAGVGHRYWSDYSVGPEWVDRLAKLEWPSHVTLQDYSFGAWAMTQQLQDDKYERCIFIAAEPRGRKPASIHVYPYQFDEKNFDPLRVHDHMFEAVAGVISIDLLLVVAGHFKALPKDTWVIELEPANVNFADGQGLSREITNKYAEVEHLVKILVRGEIPERAETQSAITLGSYGQLARQKGLVN
jgi:hydrogenase maturation protease